MAKRGYLLNLYYSSLKDKVAQVERVKGFVVAVSGDDWKVMSFGDHICTIVFFSDTLNATAFHRDMTGVSAEDFCYAMFRVEMLVSSHGYGKGAAWFQQGLRTIAAQGSGK